MSMFNKISEAEYEDSRREFLVRALTAGLFAVSGSMVVPGSASASIFGDKPQRMPKNKSIYSMNGDVWVNQNPATVATLIKPGDLVKTGNKGNITFVVGKDAFILRGNSQLQLEGQGFLLSSMRLVTGKLLSVFGKRHPAEQKLMMYSSIATIGIRGTGVYMEAEEDLTYLCACYGMVDMQSRSDQKSQTTVTASHHDAPKYILAEGDQGKRIIAAPMINHTDLELMLIEELVGRKPPFGIESMEYKAPRRSY